MKTPKKKRKIVNVFLYVWICVLTFAALNNITHSNYASKTSNAGGETEVATPIITISRITLNDANNDLLKKEIEFTVQNYELNDDTKRSEVSMNYYLNILKKSGLPITYTLYKLEGTNRQEIVLNDNSTAIDVLPHTVKAQHSYILSLTFTSPPSNQDIEDAVTIALNATQVQ